MSKGTPHRGGMPMRRLMLLRHAKAETPTAGQRDADRSLAERGREVAPQMGRYMAQHGLTPDRALVSTSKRTRETWDLVASALAKKPPADFEERVYEASAKAILSAVHAIDAKAHTLLVVGHNPGIQQLAVLLVASGDSNARHSLAEKFPTAALAVIDFGGDRWSDIKASTGRLDRFVTPRSLSIDAD